jgi:hypothetical protein
MSVWNHLKDQALGAVVSSMLFGADALAYEDQDKTGEVDGGLGLSFGRRDWDARIGVPEAGSIRTEHFRGALELVEIGIEGNALRKQGQDIMRLPNRSAVERQEGFERLFGGLLRVVNGDVPQRLLGVK